MKERREFSNTIIKFLVLNFRTIVFDFLYEMQLGI